MIRLVNHDTPRTARRIREELAAARGRLRTAAQAGSQRTARSSRRARRTAEHRVREAAQVLRRYRPGTPWPWLGVGLALGVVAGAVVAATLRRRQAAESEPAPVAAALRERGAAVADRAAHAARETIARARRAGRRSSGDEAVAAEWAGAESADRPDGARPALDPDPDTNSQ